MSAPRIPDLSDLLFLSFEALEDPRARNSHHSLEKVLFIAVVGVLCGANGFVQMERVARSKQSLLGQLVDMRGGVPSHDTISRVFQMLDPDALAQAFMRFIAATTGRSLDDVIAIDGKTLRGALNKAAYNEAKGEDQVHMVSAFSVHRRVVLGQLRSAAKANESEIARKLLSLINVKGAVVTGDAAHCYPDTLKIISDNGGDFVVGVKANQPSLFEQMTRDFHEHADEALVSATKEKSRGRLEERHYEALSARGVRELEARWPSARCYVRVIRRVTVNGRVSEETRYYLSSLPPEDVESIANAIRSHWAIENSLHYVLDVAFREDLCRVRTDNAAENLSRIRHIVLSLLHQRTEEKVGLETKRLVAAMDDDFALRVIRGEPAKEETPQKPDRPKRRKARRRKTS